MAEHGRQRRAWTETSEHEHEHENGDGDGVPVSVVSVDVEQDEDASKNGAHGDGGTKGPGSVREERAVAWDEAFSGKGNGNADWSEEMDGDSRDGVADMEMGEASSDKAHHHGGM